MSKKTNAAKQKAKIKRPRAHKRKPRNALFTPFVFPEGVADMKLSGPPLELSGMMGPLVDSMLGIMFVQALKRTGLREAVLNVLFRDAPLQSTENPEAKPDEAPQGQEEDFRP